MDKAYDDKQFTKDFLELTARILKKLYAAETTEEVQEELNMLEQIASNKNAPASAKTDYGLAYLIEGKPWYDFQRGFEAVKEGADTAQDNEAFCWFVLGSLYLNGKPELQKDLISAKHWICKAADAGYKEAEILKDLYWGDHPVGFRDYLLEQIEKDYDRKQKLKKWLPGIIILIAVGLIIYLLLR